MMRIISPRGQLLLIQRVQPMCEKTVLFNGENRIMMGRANDLSVKPTAVVMKLLDETTSWNCDISLVVGNLEPEMVVENIQTLCKKGYFDFSQLTYQKAEFSKRILDDGKSGAYAGFIEGGEYSSLFGREFPHILDAEGIEIQKLESPTDLSGCICWELNHID